MPHCEHLHLPACRRPQAARRARPARRRSAPRADARCPRAPGRRRTRRCRRAAELGARTAGWACVRVPVGGARTIAASVAPSRRAAACLGGAQERAGVAGEVVGVHLDRVAGRGGRLASRRGVLRQRPRRRRCRRWPSAGVVAGAVRASSEARRRVDRPGRRRRRRRPPRRRRPAAHRRCGAGAGRRGRQAPGRRRDRVGRRELGEHPVEAGRRRRRGPARRGAPRRAGGAPSPPARSSGAGHGRPPLCGDVGASGRSVRGGVGWTGSWLGCGRRGRPCLCRTAGSSGRGSPAAWPGSPRRAQDAEQRGQPGPAARAARLHGADRAVEHRGDLGDRVALHVDQHQRGALLGGSWRARRAPAAALVGRALGRRGRRPRRSPSAASRGRRTPRGPRAAGRRGAPCAARMPVEAGVDDDPVQPGGDRGVAAEASRPGGRPRSCRPAGRRRRPRGCPWCAARPPRAGRGAGGRGSPNASGSPSTWAASSSWSVRAVSGPGCGSVHPRTTTSTTSTPEARRTTVGSEVSQTVR